MPKPSLLTAPAKVNLGLEIVRRRPDGYHDLETVFYRIALSDEIELDDRPERVSMECSDPLLSCGPDNLCYRAAETIRREAGVERGVHIVLRKRIPTGAGLGGGSSDAAAVLRGLNERWSLGLSYGRLRTLAASLGSDVPAFLGAPLSYGSGRGEIVSDIPGGFPHWVVTVTPPVAVSTAWAYAHVQIPERSVQPSLRDRFLSVRNDLSSLAHLLVNDFEPSVLTTFPPIAEAKRRLAEAGCAVALLSGSGSSVFGLAADRDTAVLAGGQFGPPFIVSITPPLA